MTAASYVMRKISFVFLALLTFFMSLSVHASDSVQNDSFVNDSVYYQDGIYYQLIEDNNGTKDGALAVIDWDADMTEVSIPEGIYINENEPETTEPAMYNNIPMETRRYTVITWFRTPTRLIDTEHYKVERILLSMNIEFAPDVDFSIFKYLVSLDLPLSMKEIRPRCFKNCKALRSITIKDNIERIGEEAFAGCTSLYSFNVKANAKLQSIGDRAFANCTSLRNLSFTRRLGYIGSEAFLNCSSLSTVQLPEYISFLSRDAFKGCDNITSFKIGNYEEYCSYYTYDDCIYNVINGSQRELYIVAPAKKTFVLDSESTQLGNRIFYGHKNLSTIYIPDNIDFIGEAVFANCKELKKVRLSERLKNIPDSCFYGCEKLEQVKLPGSTENIGKWAFGCCNSITSIDIPTHVKSIGNGAFANCATLQNFTVDEWNTEFAAHDGALYNCGYKYAYNYTPYDLHLICCPGGKKEVAINEETVMILDNSFYGCRKLESLHIPAKVFYIYPRAFGYCDSMNNFSVSEENTRYKSVDGMLIDNNNSLCSFPGGREEAIINPTRKTIGTSFYSDYDRIESDAFYACNKLKKVSFKISIGINGPNFLACDNISEINLYGYAYEDIYNSEDSKIFVSNVYETAQLNVYYNSETAWLPSSVQKSLLWSKFKNINYIETSGIEDCIIDDNTTDDTSITVYSINGMKYGNNVDNLKPGVYIIKQGNKTKKVIKL